MLSELKARHEQENWLALLGGFEASYFDGLLKQALTSKLPKAVSERNGDELGKLAQQFETRLRKGLTKFCWFLRMWSFP